MEANIYTKTTMKQKRGSQLLAMAMLASFLLLPAHALAAKKADFSGEWALNESKSDLGEGRFFSAVKMAVTQEKNTMTLERTRVGRDGQERTNSEVLTLDGKENINKRENRSSTSTATWSDDGKTLTIKTDTEFNRQGETFKMKSTETWALGEDGKTLIIRSESSSRRGERSVTLVYDRKP